MSNPSDIRIQHGAPWCIIGPANGLARKLELAPLQLSAIVHAAEQDPVAARAAPLCRRRGIVLLDAGQPPARTLRVKNLVDSNRCVRQSISDHGPARAASDNRGLVEDCSAGPCAIDNCKDVAG